MPDPAETPDPILSRLEDEDESPECRIAGCDRPGNVPRRLADPSGEGAMYTHYVCQYHHRLLLAIKVAIAMAVVALFVLAVIRV